MRRNNCAKDFSGETGRIGGQATSGTSPGEYPEAIPLRSAASMGKVRLAGKCPHGGRAEAQPNKRRGHGSNRERPTDRLREADSCNRVTYIILPLGEGGRECAEREDCAFTIVLSWRWLWNGSR